VLIPGEAEKEGQLHLNFTSEGLISDVFTDQAVEGDLAQNVGTSLKLIEDMVFESSHNDWDSEDDGSCSDCGADGGTTCGAVKCSY
jgi:hypothetical protein